MDKYFRKKNLKSKYLKRKSAAKVFTKNSFNRSSYRRSIFRKNRFNRDGFIRSWWPVVMWMVVIFWFSHQPATQSGAMSGSFTQIVLNLLLKFNIHIDMDMLHHIIRKFAHFTIYTILGFNVFMSLSKSNNDFPLIKRITMAMTICILYAMSDELHQLFIAGRSGQIKDVLIDSLGSAFGILIRIPFIKFANEFQKY